MSLIADPSSTPAAGSQPIAGQSAGNDAGSQASAFDFRTVLPEDIRSEKSFEPFAKVKNHQEFVQQLARSFHSAQGLIGKRGPNIPGEGSSPEEIAAFNKALGVPEKPDDYKFDAPEGFKFDEARIAAWRKELHAAGVPAKAANKIVGSYIKEEQAIIAQRQAEIQKWENDTKAEFGANLDKALNNVNYALRELDQNGEVFKILESTGLGSNKDVIRLLANAGAALAERGPRGDGAGAAHSLAPDQAQVEIQQLERNHREALFNKNHPDHDFVVKRRAELYKAAFPTQQ